MQRPFRREPPAADLEIALHRIALREELGRRNRGEQCVVGVGRKKIVDEQVGHRVESDLRRADAPRHVRGNPWRVEGRSVPAVAVLGVDRQGEVRPRHVQLQLGGASLRQSRVLAQGGDFSRESFQRVVALPGSRAKRAKLAVKLLDRLPQRRDLAAHALEFGGQPASVILAIAAPFPLQGPEHARAHQQRPTPRFERHS
jgi:hypothetical protein